MSSEWQAAESSGSWEDAQLSDSWTGNDQDNEVEDMGLDQEDDLRSSRRSVEARDDGRGKSSSSSDQIDPNDFDTFSINSTQAGGRKKKLNQAQVFAIKRLMKDYQELHAHPIPFVHAAPIDGNLFLWHGNLRGPANSPFEGGIFHIVITISEDYPSSPPSIALSNTIPHPFVFGNSVCLNLLQEASSTEPYSGWSPIYSIQSVLLQLQSFLLDGLEASQIPTGFNVSFSQKQASAWKVIFENRDKQGDGTLIPSEVRELMLEVGERKPSPAELALYYRMLNLPADHAIDFSQFLTILEKKREYRKVVEEANRYSCTHSKCHHRQQHPWPPYPEISESNFVSHQTESEMVLAETRCFFSKRSFLAPENETLGVGVSFTRNPRDGTVHSIDSSLDILSLRAFRKHKIHTSVNNQQTFTHWLPLYINKDHAPKCLHLLPRSLGIICAGSHHNFKPDMVLQVLPKLLSGLVLSLTKGEIYVSVKVLEGYSYFYRLFLAAARQYPEIKALCQEKYNSFLADPEHRTKKNISNISDFLSTVSIVDSFDFSALAVPILEEMDARSVPWILKKRPEFDCEPNAKVDRDRASASFELSFSGYQLLLVHKFLLENVAHPTGNSVDQIEEDLDSRFGRPRSDILDRFQLAIASIRNISSYKGLYRYLGLEVPSDEQILQKLYASLQRSRDLFYHGPKQRSLTRPDDYAKFKLKDFASLESLLIDDPSAASSSSSAAPTKVLMSNEEVWQDMAKMRFGVKELPQQEAALNPIQDPWRHLYLQLNLQELLNELNDNRDLKTLYHTIDISAPYLKVLEFTVCCVSNIKSGYHFLNPLLTRLQIEKLAIRNGEGTLGVKGCKNLCKGLQNNKQTLRIIDLHHTKFTPDCVAMLEAGILSCKNLISLNLEGNPLGSSGANTLAKILMYHQGITDLNISNCAIDQTGAKAISTALYHNKTLRTFRFGKNPVTTAGLAHILKNLAYSPSITSIDTGRTQASSSDRQLSDAVVRLLEVNTSLKSINLYMTEIGPNFNNDTLHAFAKNRSVTVIDMGSCNLNDNHCREIGKAVAINKNITTLILEQNNFSEAGVVNLTRSIYDKPKEVRRRNKLKSEGATLSDADLAEDLQPRGCSLTDINIANNTLSINSKTSMKALQRFISLTTTLTTLNLQNCSLQVLAGEALGNGLATHPSLVHLSLKGNRLGEHGIRKFCRAIAKNSVLKFLDLTSNDIGARGASAVCTLLEQPTIAIENLCLFGNLIGIEGARFLAKSIGINRSLKELDLGLNRIRPKGCLALAAGLRLNPTLQTLKLKLNFINDKAALALCASIIGTAEILAQTSSSSSSSSEEKKEEEKKAVVESVESVSSIKKLCLAGNRVKRAVLLQIAETFKESAKPIEIDVAQLLSVRTPARLARTVFLSPLPFDILETSLRKFFYEAGCGAIVNVAIINSTRDRSNFVYSKAKFAFVEFADIDSVEVAMEIEKGRCRIGRAVFKIIQAGKGITGKAKKASAGSGRDAPPPVRGAPSRGRESAGRGFQRARGRGRR